MNGAPPGPVVRDIPLALLPAFRGRNLILRTGRARDLPAALSAQDLSTLAYVQLSGLPADSDALVHWAEGLPIDLLLADPAVDLARLYPFARLLDNHPVRVTLPVTPGFERAVKLAASLHFAVRLELGQPTDALIASLSEVLDLYLHRSTVTEPIEPFHSLLLGLCAGGPVSIWAIQEEDPRATRRIDDQGRERLPGRLAGIDLPADPARFVEDRARALVEDGGECARCPFFDHCQGYFKWPSPDYDCGGVKGLFQTLARAGSELRADLAARPMAAGGAP